MGSTAAAESSNVGVLITEVGILIELQSVVAIMLTTVVVVLVITDVTVTLSGVVFVLVITDVTGTSSGVLFVLVTTDVTGTLSGVLFVSSYECWSRVVLLGKGKSEVGDLETSTYSVLMRTRNVNTAYIYL